MTIHIRHDEEKIISSLFSHNSHGEDEINLPSKPSLSPDAIPGELGDFIHSATCNSEANPAAVLATFLVRFSTEIGNGPHIYVGDEPHFARLYVAIVGTSSKARKGTSMASVRSLFELKDCTHCQITPGPLSTGEGLIYSVRDPINKWIPGDLADEGRFEMIDPGIEDKRIFVIEEEFAASLANAQKKQNTLSPILRLLWDSGSCSPITKTNKISTTNAHVGIVSHITTTELHSRLGNTDIHNGFANRFIWILSYRNKKVSFPRSIPEDDMNRYKQWLFETLKIAQSKQKIEFSEDAIQLWDEIYEQISDEKPGIIGSICNRAEAQLIRLSLIYALIDRKSIIEPNHIKSALAFWKYAEESVKYIFAYKSQNSLSNRIMD